LLKLGASAVLMAIALVALPLRADPASDSRQPVLVAMVSPCAGVLAAAASMGDEKWVRYCERQTVASGGTMTLEGLKLTCRKWLAYCKANPDGTRRPRVKSL